MTDIYMTFIGRTRRMNIFTEINIFVFIKVTIIRLTHHFISDIVETNISREKYLGGKT